ncbi:cysteine-rich with EGF-like domain protein 2 [Synchiropus splendidus]|uniref:cysteine-rich with EGF-like domain protein 2 n=1 Tax=Synchiropus splendidus TaxID=270530 RepID=UPI00237EA9DE|nr:cysteine-rich with EGF-like domain protein 2 [Synchiropus splendidus]
MQSSSSEPRLVRLLLCVFVLVLLPPSYGKRDLKSACSTCQKITENFSKGFEKTTNQNFGGGNTAWEERKLSKYETSEIRLMEIMEDLCESSSFECNQMLEEHEELFETWWFKRKTKHPDLHKWFCIETIKVCCPKGTFGPDCNACVGGSEKPCHSNGVCDGDGTRGGDGKCSCNHGYKGEFCLDCSDGFYSQEKNDSFALCSECHESCITCNGATHQDCDECKAGWQEDDQEACVDVDECSRDTSPCKDDQFCLNSEGSFSCKACDKVCSSCIGPGPDKCQNCAAGYQNTDGTCTDVDECLQSDVCALPHRHCVNSRGSYSCICSNGYEEKDGECVEVVLQDEEENKEEDATNPHKEL